MGTREGRVRNKRQQAGRISGRRWALRGGGLPGGGGGVAALLNDGDGVFTERTAESGVAVHTGSMTMTLTDVDGDGHLDLYVANYKTRSAMDVYSPRERAFDQVVRRVGRGFEVVPKFRKDYRGVDRPEYNLVSMQQRADPGGFYLNDGKGHFTVVPWTKGRF